MEPCAGLGILLEVQQQDIQVVQQDILDVEVEEQILLVQVACTHQQMYSSQTDHIAQQAFERAP